MFFDFISDLVIGACDLGFKLDTALFGDSSADADALMKVILDATHSAKAEDEREMYDEYADDDEDEEYDDEYDEEDNDEVSAVATSIKGIKKYVY